KKKENTPYIVANKEALLKADNLKKIAAKGNVVNELRNHERVQIKNS
ncbi:8901_t:CDS:1, partial [Scutellospora calospora]